MTVYRAPGTVEDTLARVLRVLSPADLAEATGKGVDAFRKASNPNAPHGLRLDDAAALDAALVARGYAPEFGPLFAELQQRAAARMRPLEPGAPDIDRGLRRVVAETGALSTAIDRAMADGRLSTRERREIASEAQDVIEAARHIRDAVEPPAEPRVVHPAA